MQTVSHIFRIYSLSSGPPFARSKINTLMGDACSRGPRLLAPLPSSFSYIITYTRGTDGGTNPDECSGAYPLELRWKPGSTKMAAHIYTYNTARVFSKLRLVHKSRTKLSSYLVQGWRDATLKPVKWLLTFPPARQAVLICKKPEHFETRGL